MDIKIILVPFDFGDPALHALEYARGLAERFGSSLHLLHVVPNPYQPNTYMPFSPDAPAAYYLPGEVIQQFLKEAEDRLEHVLPTAEREAYRARCFIESGDARKEILDHAVREKVDLIVMGTHGRTGAAHVFIGSVAEKVVRSAPCPVLTVR